MFPGARPWLWCCRNVVSSGNNNAVCVGQAAEDKTAIMKKSRSVFRARCATPQRRRASTIRAAASTLALCAAFAQAQDATPVEPLVVTATRIATAQDSLSSDTTVITAAQLAASNAQTLGEALASVPGVQFSRAGGQGQPASLYIRGANANQTLVLVDGLRIGSATLGGTSFDLLPLAMIDHIEILRGPASGLYGSDAVGGVVQIFTKRGKGTPHMYASVGYGTDRTTSETAGLASTSEDNRFSFDFSHKQSQGFNVTKPSSAFYYEDDRDGYKQTSGSFDIAHFFDASNELGVRGYWIQSDTAFDAGGSPVNPWTRETQTSLALYSRNQINSNWLSDLSIGQSHDQSHADALDYDTFLPYTSRFDTRQKQLNWSNTVTSSVGKWLLGLDYLDERISSTTNYTVDSRHTKAGLLGWQNDFGANHLQANLRVENNSQFGSQTTGNIGYLLHLNSQWQFTANAGTSFHAPTFNDLYFDCGYVCANPNLQAEKGRAFDLGLRWQAGGFNTSLVGFENRVRNLIVLDANNNYLPENLNEARIEGFTLATQGTLGGFDLAGSVTRQNPFDDATGHVLPRRARILGEISVAQSVGQWRWNAAMNAAGRRFDDLANQNVMGGYAAFDLGLDYALSKTWKAGVRLNNAFDRDYELVRDYNIQGRAWFVTLSYDGAGL